MAPTDSRIRANLDHARKRVEPYIEEPAENRLLHNLLFWHYSTTPMQRLWTAAILSVLGWLLIAIRIRRRTAPVIPVAVIFIVLSLVCTSSLVWELHEHDARPTAVIVSGEHFLRTGRGRGYDPVTKEPLGEGVELRVLNRAGGWVEVELRNGRSGWIPAAAIERV
jgi:hypothetical protein